ADPQHFLNFLPLPQGYGSLRPTLRVLIISNVQDSHIRIAARLSCFLQDGVWGYTGVFIRGCGYARTRQSTAYRPEAPARGVSVRCQEPLRLRGGTDSPGVARSSQRIGP